MAKQITAALCASKVKARTKVFDSKCQGFYVSLTPSKGATFAFRYWDNKTGKQPSVTIGIYHPENFTVEAARIEAFNLKARVGRGEDISETVRVDRARHIASSGVTVAQAIDEYLDYISTPVVKADGKKRPRIESWKNVRGYLNVRVRPVIGHKLVANVTNNDIAHIQGTIAKQSTSSARQTRSAMNRLFKFSAQAGRSYITASPCVNLPSLDKEYERTHVLTPEEIKTFWWGLDDPEVPCLRVIALALKFELVTMLRSQEVRSADRNEITGLGSNAPVIRIPLEYVKKRRVIYQPMNSLAVEIAKEGMKRSQSNFLFSHNGERLSKSALSRVLIGKPHIGRYGVLDYLGLKKFTPHDLRRTASTLAGDLGFPDIAIGKCLDHSKDRGEDVVEAPTVTGRVYNQSKRLDEKRAVLNGIDKALREIIGARPKYLRLVA